MLSNWAEWIAKRFLKFGFCTSNDLFLLMVFPDCVPNDHLAVAGTRECVLFIVNYADTSSLRSSQLCRYFMPGCLGVRMARSVKAGRDTKKSFRWRSQRRGVSRESLRRKIIFNDFPSYSYRIHIKRKLTLEIWRKNCHASMVLWRNWIESWLPWFLDFSRALSGQQQNYIFLWHSTTREFWVTLRKRWRITREGQGLSRRATPCASKSNVNVAAATTRGSTSQ